MTFPNAHPRRIDSWRVARNRPQKESIKPFGMAQIATACVQTVDGVGDPVFHAMILRFAEIADYAMLVSTS